MTKTPEFSTDETAALTAFAKEYGREWKSYLTAAWLSYAHKGIHMGGRDTGILRTIRNTHGVEWLTAYRLPKADA